MVFFVNFAFLLVFSFIFPIVSAFVFLFLFSFDGAWPAVGELMQLCRGAAGLAEEVPGCRAGLAAPQLEPTWRSNGGE